MYYVSNFSISVFCLCLGVFFVSCLLTSAIVPWGIRWSPSAICGEMETIKAREIYNPGVLCGGEIYTVGCWVVVWGHISPGRGELSGATTLGSLYYVWPFMWIQMFSWCTKFCALRALDILYKLRTIVAFSFACLAYTANSKPSCLLFIYLKTIKTFLHV